jgi:hypothetical protein
VATDAFVNTHSSATPSLSVTVTTTATVSLTQTPSPSANSAPVGAIVGGVIGGLALIACLAAFIILKKRDIEKQGGTYNLSQWNDHGNKDNPPNASNASNAEPGGEQNERYGTRQNLIYPNDNLQGNN